MRSSLVTEHQEKAMLRAAPWRRAFFTIMRVVFSLVLIFPMLTFGAVDFEPLAVITMLIVISAVMVCWRPIQHLRVSFIAGMALVCFIVLALVQYGQSLRFPNNPWEHPAWVYVRALVGPVDGAASVIPEQTRADIIVWSPLLTFVVALHLFNRRREAFLLLSMLSHLVVGVAVISLCQFLFAPMTLGFETKTAYIGSLTGLYVNRNSAGTFFGMGIVINAGLLVFYLQNSSLGAFARKIFTPDRLTSTEKTTLSLLIGMMIEVLALAATQSRGATASTFLGLMCLAWLLNQRKRSGHRPKARWRRFVLIASLMLIVTVVVAQEAVYRMGAQSVDQARLCTYASTAQAVRDNWPLGSGFGSFADVFPAYRSPQCSGIEGVWDAAHNSYLEGALGLGVVFVAVLAVALAILGWALVTGLHERRSYRFAPAIGLASLVLVAVHSLIDFSLQIPGNALFLAALLAGCVTISLGGKTSFEPNADNVEQATWAADQS
jgi:hypothetical protein